MVNALVRFPTLSVFIASVLVLVPAITLSPAERYSWWTIVGGVFVFLYLPGFALVRSFVDGPWHALIGQSIILGFVSILLYTGVYYSLQPFLTVSLMAVVVIGSTSTVIIATLLPRKLRQPANTFHNRYWKGEHIFLAIFFFAIIIRLWYSSYNTQSILPDASLYLDIARNLVSTGTFSSHVINDSTSLLTPYAVQNGLVEHVPVTFSFGFFMLLGGVGLRSALWSSILGGSLLIFPIGWITRSLVGPRASIVASLLASVDPLFLYYSSSLFGPEILATLLATYSLALLVSDSGHLRFRILIAGTCLGLVDAMWFPLFYVTILFFFVVAVWTARSHKMVPLIARQLVLAIALLFSTVVALKITSLYFISVPIALVCTLSLIFSKRVGRIFQLCNYFTFGALVAPMLIFLRQYELPVLVGPTVQNSISNGLSGSIFEAFIIFFQGGSFSGFLDFYRYFTYYETIVLMALFLIFIAYNRKPIILFATVGVICEYWVLVSFLPPPVFPMYLDSFGRFFLLPTALTIIAASWSLDRIISVIERVSARVRPTTGKSWVPRIPSLIGCAFMIICIGISFYPQYGIDMKYVATSTTPSFIYGWNDGMIQWIVQNTSSSSVLMSPGARELAWLTHRNSVDIVYPNMTPAQITFVELSVLSHRFNATYLVTDGYFDTVYPKLNDLLKPVPSAETGETVVPSAAMMELASNQTINYDGYELVFKSSTVQIWRIIYPVDIARHWQQVSTFSQSSWSAGNYGSLLDNGRQLVIGPSQNYTYTHSTVPLNIHSTEGSEILVGMNVTAITNSNIDRIEIWNSTNARVDNLFPPSSVGVWYAYFSEPSIDDLRLVISGSPGGSLNLNWFLISIYYNTVI